MNLPPIARVRRNFVQPEVADVAAEVAQAIRTSHLAARVLAGGRIAITVGSRGIAGLPRIVRAVADAVRGLGFQPFVVAAMGSHGGGTAEGQRALLAELGVTEATVGCPVRSEMDTVVLGKNSFGLPIHFDQNAFDADGIILLNRIKPHTSFTGRYESGLLKMLAIGLGKRQGAAQVHKLGPARTEDHAPGGRRLPAQANARGAWESPSSRTPSSTRRGSSRSSRKACWRSNPACSTRRAS